MIKLIAIGLGQQALKEHLPAILKSDKFDLVGVYDINPASVETVSKKFKVKGFINLDKLIGATGCDAALVTVPHNKYVPIIAKLADAGVHIIKEKPFATTNEEASAIHKAVNDRVFLGVTLQRRFNPIYQAFLQMQRHIGKIYSIEGKYVLNIAKLDEGWRASKAQAGGGALVDMGYHFIDLLVWYFGVPQTVTARITRGNRDGQKYDVEDTVNMLFDFYLPQSYEEKTIGNFLISRVYPKKQEILTVYGVKGILELQQGQICRYDADGGEIEKLVRQDSWPSSLTDQLDHFAEAILAGTCWNLETLKQHLPHVAIIESAYESNRKSTSCRPEIYLQRALEVCTR